MTPGHRLTLSYLPHFRFGQLPRRTYVTSAWPNRDIHDVELIILSTSTYGNKRLLLPSCFKDYSNVFGRNSQRTLYPFCVVSEEPRPGHVILFAPIKGKQCRPCRSTRGDDASCWIARWHWSMLVNPKFVSYCCNYGVILLLISVSCLQ